MTLREWTAFILMAILWGSLSHTGAHYAELALRTYRVRRTDEWFERHIRPFLQ